VVEKKLLLKKNSKIKFSVWNEDAKNKI